MMPLISTGEAPLDVEDSTYLSAAIENVSLATEHKRKNEYPAALKAMMHAIKGINTLVALRKEKYPAYAVLEAPFYYAQGNLLGSYVEANADVVLETVERYKQEDAKD